MKPLKKCTTILLVLLLFIVGLVAGLLFIRIRKQGPA